MKHIPTFKVRNFVSMLVSFALALVSLTATAFDIDALLDRARMGSLAIPLGEQALAIGGDTPNQPYVVALLGESTFFLDRYGPDKQRISRSVPLPTPRCLAAPNPRQGDRLFMGIRELAGGVLLTTNPCPIGDTIFFQDADGNIMSFARPTGLVATDLGVSVWAGPKPDAIEPNLLKLFSQMKEPATGRVYAIQRFVIAFKTGPGDASLAALVDRPLATIADRANHFLAVRQAVWGIDWRRPSVTTETLNNAAFYLVEAGSCDDLDTATTMLKHILVVSPNRHVANLNLADAFVKVTAQQCPRWQSAWGDSQEAFRLYCSAIGWKNVSARVLSRYRNALVTPKTETGDKCQPQFAMQRAILSGDTKALAEALADPENDVNITFPDGRRALGLALDRKQGLMARMLLAAQADPDRASFYIGSDRQYETPPMVSALWNYDVETLAALVAKGRSALDFSMRTTQYRPLFMAVALRPDTPEQEVKKLAMIDLILSLKPSPLDTNDAGDNAFNAAAQGYSSAAVFERLVKLGVFVNQPSKHGSTPLFAIGPFANHGAERTQSALLALGANPNQQNSAGDTPLVYAFAFSGSSTPVLADMVARLLKAGADPNIANNRSHTALTLAAMRPMPDTVDLLIAHGAKLPAVVPNGTDTLAWVRARISEMEANPSREIDCKCLADYRRIWVSLNKISAVRQ